MLRCAVLTPSAVENRFSAAPSAPGKAKSLSRLGKGIFEVKRTEQRVISSSQRCFKFVNGEKFYILRVS